MKTSQSIVPISFLFLFMALGTACEKTSKSDPDTFLVSVSDEVFEAGSQIVYNTSSTEFTLSYAPGTGKKAAPDASTGDFWIANTELSYKLWKEISDWATNNGYLIDIHAQPGSDVSFSHKHPVTRVCWYDAVVWSNALTEFYNSHNGERPDYSFAYLVNGDPIRNSEIKNTEFDELEFNASATGFRIPTNDEWYKAAAYGSGSDDSASGASGHYDDENATGAVCWYRINSDMQTHPVAQKLPNNLGVYDMSGNVSEIVFDLLDMYYGKSNIRGGAWSSNPSEVTVTASHPTEEHTSSTAVGIRIVRTTGDEPQAQ